MTNKKSKIPADVQIAIAAALGRYLKDDKLAFHVVSIKPVQHGNINLWALSGRSDIMTGYRKK
jgi:hypothetical protein